MTKCFAIAAALFVSTGASAQPAGAHRHGMAHPGVLANIMGRVQMDALINAIVDTDAAPTQLAADTAAVGNTKVSRLRRVSYASNTSTAQRSRG